MSNKVFVELIIAYLENESSPILSLIELSLFAKGHSTDNGAFAVENGKGELTFANALHVDGDLETLFAADARGLEVGGGRFARAVE